MFLDIQIGLVTAKGVDDVQGFAVVGADDFLRERQTNVCRVAMRVSMPVRVFPHEVSTPDGATVNVG